MEKFFFSLALLGLCTTAALTVPRWRTPLGPIAETLLVIVLLGLAAYRVIPEALLSRSYLLLSVLAYALIRVQRFLLPPIDEPLAAQPTVLPRSFDAVAISRSLHLVPIAGSVTLEIALLPSGHSVFPHDWIFMTFGMAMMALTSRRNAVWAVCVLFVSGALPFV